MIVAAVVAGAVAAAKDVTAQVVKDSYAGLKALLVGKFSGRADIGDALEGVEKKPDSKGRQQTLSEELKASGAGQDAEVMKQAKALLDLLKEHGLAGGSSYIANLNGNGVIAQDHSISAGVGGIAIGRDLYGDVYVGPTPRRGTQALEIYRRTLAGTSSELPLRGVDLGTSDPAGNQQRLSLSQVYVDLNTKTQVPVAEKEGARKEMASFDERTKRPLSALEAVVSQRLVVLLGDPGSGKSTFLNHLALCLAAHSLEPSAGWLKRLTHWQKHESDVVPVMVVLRDFAHWVPDVDEQATPQHLWDFIVKRLKSQNLAFAADPLQEALDMGKAIVLLDGLDEIPTKKQHTFVRNAVAAFVNRYHLARFIVTCRTLSYQESEWQLVGFSPFELAPFDDKKIDRFIGAWYEELARLRVIKSEEAAGLAGKLQNAVRRPDLWRLAPNPLLLTVMALVHTHKGRLPDARALLYEDTVDILLWRWEQIKVGGDEKAPHLRRLLLEVGRSDVDLKRVLWKLAFQAHREGGAADKEALGDISELQLQDALLSLHPDGSRDWAHEVIQSMKLRAGLLLERAPGTFTFPHRTFQEYLAGAHLSTQADFAKQSGLLMVEGAFWREVVLLAVGRLVYLGGDIDKPLAVVGELCSEQMAGDEVAWRKAWLAGEVLVELGMNRVLDSDLGQDLSKRVQKRLISLLELGQLNSIERAAAGNALARLVDTRFRTDAWNLPDEPLLGFVEIPAGPFTMGSNKKLDPEAFDDELPQHEIILPTYYIARYPVTVAQFKAFIDESGHEPEDPDSLKGLENHPVVLITWHEAMKYCEWLTDHIRAWQGTPEPLATLLRQGDGGGPPWRIILPSEAEWEKAARSADGRIYPWGDEPNQNRANYDQTGIGATSPVGCFPGGASPYGCLDMAGNVWEWTRSLWGKKFEKPDFAYPYNPKDGREDLEAGKDWPRVLRGGAFGNPDRFLRCAFRSGYDPDLRSWYIGFRVALSPL
jgi:formylglycine-generating enzyme required for sulfatase activity/energy-coupling factor transporter ATP-binding protein EcfA2